ncbi:capsular polysaccharide biosynthesis protein [Dinoroseobacter sp. S124A]|uniref:capsular polysaccharide biosynthesis protein n=1 Tax=Dinoroseobacter sp. S124A TaxID=3415128 RepID=UPI003C7C5729
MRGDPRAPFLRPGTPVYLSSLSHLTDRNLRRILSLKGLELRLGWPKPGGHVAIWGRSGRTGARGEALARRSGAKPLYLEDAFLRSVLPGKAGGPRHGITLDQQRPYYDATGPSDLEDLLATHPLQDIARGEALIAALQEAGLSKYNAATAPPPAIAPGYVLVVDQLRDDASIRYGGADAARFDAMLQAARDENPGREILIKGHPAARSDRPGHLGPDGCGPCAIWPLLAGAAQVYTVSSQVGFEAILSGHRPHVFGQPFYAGWGLSEDRAPLPRRQRVLSAAQLALGTLALYPVWYDPFRDRLCEVEEVIAQLASRARAWREDHHGYVAHGMRLWKRPTIRKVFGSGGLSFPLDPGRAAQATGRPILSWAQAVRPEMAEARAPLYRVEDGFLRSKGLGAALVPPLSLVRDGTGIYYDPAGPSDLEHCITRAAARGASPRGRALLARLRAGGLTKYNTDGRPPDPAPDGARTLLVIGQVADDASVTLGHGGEVRDMEALLTAARAANPAAHILYKPHPDVEAGLRPGLTETPLADSIARGADPVACVMAADEVWTLSSLLGFEALIRGRPVTCAGLPFYAGWGLTRDLARDLTSPPHPAFARRAARPDLAALVEAVLIDYPRYHDPVTNLPCPVEVILDRLESGPPTPAPPLRLLSKLQGVLASQSWLWR